MSAVLAFLYALVAARSLSLFAAGHNPGHLAVAVVFTFAALGMVAVAVRSR